MHYKIFTIVVLSLLFSSIESFSQNLTQTIRGTVTNSDNRAPLVGAALFIKGAEKGTTTDPNGIFRLEEVPVGRHILEVSYLGFTKLVLSEILLESGKELVLELEMEESGAELNEIVVRGIDPNRSAKVYPAHELLTIEETMRLPATFFDPARLALSYAGVSGTNDQANHMIVRGNSPNNNSWRLEGVEIVNPNHLGNAGTNTDRPARNGGGVNILSAQMLGNSTFMRGAFPVAYGNVLSSVMDMRFRKGNNQKHELTGQIGVVGVDLAAEGPISKKSKISYLANYRYSTLGLLGAAGVDLGDEAINFQDFALKVNVPINSKSELSFFGFLGNSENDFSAKAIEEITIAKEALNILFESKMKTAGFKYNQVFDEKWKLEWTTVASEVKSNRNSEVDTFSTAIPFNVANLESQKISSNAFAQYKMNPKMRLHFGMVATWLKDENSSTAFAFNEPTVGGVIEGTLLQPYFNWSFRQSNISLDLGGRYVHFLFNNTSSLEPNALFQYRLKKNQNIGLSYSIQSQRQLPDIYRFETENSVLDNANLELTKAHHFSLWYENIWNDVRFKTEGYYQSFFDVPIALQEKNSFSALNSFEEINNFLLTSEGTGTNYGVEISAQKYFKKNRFWLANVSLFDAKYKGSDGIERDTRFNGNYVLNATYGKEFPYSKKGKDYILGVNLSASYAGGLRETPIDLVASNLAQKTVFDNESAYSLQQNDYFKSDFRIYWKRNKKRFNSTLALDIQNITNQKNSSFQYFDTFQNQVLQQYQLGLIPILSYRIEF